jgi:hypothetical protein
MLGKAKAMTIEYLGEKIFRDETEASGEVWVARSVYRNIYSVELDAANLSLPVWSSRDKAADFLKNALLVGPKYEPDPVPLDVFTNVWLSDRMMAIAELQLNPDGKTSRVLCLTVEEFQAG